MDTMATAATALPAFSSVSCFSAPISKVAVYKVKLDFHVNVRCTYKKNISSRVYSIWENFPSRVPLLSYDKHNRLTINSAATSDTGLEVSKPEISVINGRKITVESREDGKIHVRVDVSGKDTEKTFDDVVTKFAKEMGPLPGFRKLKGGQYEGLFVQELLYSPDE
ncbi:hypothetical protein KI387_025721 [Taxus chinensis]|uniref:Trigger factor ribosome-binding bacterial domain-containing protein n=1 Tax=Taxus chinensis TaxID=29808 RepID=A0AA38KZB4_TAXCH|nr:hypothetical protein KI387_025721 [Taxus chinensis]